MKRRKIVAVIIAVAVGIQSIPVKGGEVAEQIASMVVTQQDAGQGQYIEGQVLVYCENTTVSSLQLRMSGKLTEDIQIERVYDFGEETGSCAQGLRQGGSIFHNVMLLTSEKYTTQELVKKAKKLPGVVSASPNYQFHVESVSQDPYSDMQWSLNNNGQNGGNSDSDIGITNGWSQPEICDVSDMAEKDRPVVAVLDSGVDMTQEDLQGTLWNNEYKGILQGTHGYDFVNGDGDPQDDNGHGSHVAGIIAATRGNQKGITGICNQSRIMALKFLDANGTGDMDDVIGAYAYVYQARQLGVNVVAVNNSWGGETDPDTQKLFGLVVDLLGQQGVITVSAAGNEGKDINQSYVMPACVDSDYNITVAATDESDHLASYSNYGSEMVDIAAPGTDILSTVAEPCFNFGIYDADQKVQLCQWQQDFEKQPSSENYILTPVVYAQGENQELTIDRDTKVSVHRGTGFGPQGSQGLQISMQDAHAGDTYVIAFPYINKDGTLKQGEKGYLSGVIKMEGTASESANQGKNCGSVTLAETKITSEGAVVINDSMVGGTLTSQGSRWYHLETALKSGIKKGASRGVVIEVNVIYDGEITVSLDDLAVSHTLDAEEQKQLGQYDYYSGTSMAAPIVTGSLALLGLIRPGYTTLEKRNALCNMYRCLPEQEGGRSWRHNGVLDFRHLDQYPPVVKSAAGDGTTLTLQGYFFGTEKGTVVLDGEQIDPYWINWTDQSITVSGCNWMNTQHSIALTNAYGVTTQQIFIDGASQWMKSKGSSSLLYYSEGNLFSDGSDLFFLSSEGSVYQYMGENGVGDTEKGKEDDWVLLSYFDESDVFESTTILDGLSEYDAQMVSEPVYLDDQVYTIVSYGTDYSSRKYLVSFELDSMEWNLVSEMNEDTKLQQLTRQSLGYYNGTLYLAGGYDVNTQLVSADVWTMDPQDSKPSWIKSGSLPEGRYGASLRQSGSLLYLVLGGNTQGTVPKTCVFDGKQWITVEQELHPISSSSFTVDNGTGGYKKQIYYQAQVGICKNGLVIAGLVCENLGTVFYLTHQSGGYQYHPAGVQFTHKTSDISCLGVSSGSSFYIMQSDAGSFASLSQMTISSANVIVKDISTVKRARVTGTGTYLPGQTVMLRARRVSKKYYVRYLQVAVKKCAGKTKTFTALKSIKVKAVYGYHVTKVKISRKHLTLKKGQKYRLRVKIKPAKASKAVQWKSSNKKVVSVSKKGVVRAKKTGDKVTVTAYAKDGSGKKAKCIVRTKK